MAREKASLRLHRLAEQAKSQPTVTLSMRKLRRGEYDDYCYTHLLATAEKAAHGGNSNITCEIFRRLLPHQPDDETLVECQTARMLVAKLQNDGFRVSFRFTVVENYTPRRPERLDNLFDLSFLPTAKAVEKEVIVSLDISW